MEKTALPLGFGMALAQNETAMRKFEAMNEAQKNEILRLTHAVRSRGEMQALVSRLADGEL